MLTIHKDSAGDEGVILRLEGEATVDTAAELQTALREGMQQHQQVMINCEKLRSIDFFTIQLLCSAHRTSVAWEKLFTFHGEPTPVVNEAVRLTGFARDRGCALCPEHLSCMWIEGGNHPGKGGENA